MTSKTTTKASQPENQYESNPYDHAASQLPPRETDAQRAAKLIYGSAIKTHGNP